MINGYVCREWAILAILVSVALTSQVNGIAQCDGDANGDGVVNNCDLTAIALAWGPCPGPPDPCCEDLDGDGDVDGGDTLVVILNWQNVCPSCWYVAEPCGSCDSPPSAPTPHVLCAEVESHPAGDIFFNVDGFCYVVSTSNEEVDEIPSGGQEVSIEEAFVDCDACCCDVNGLSCGLNGSCAKLDCPETIVMTFSNLFLVDDYPDNLGCPPCTIPEELEITVQGDPEGCEWVETQLITYGNCVYTVQVSITCVTGGWRGTIGMLPRTDCCTGCGCNDCAFLINVKWRSEACACFGDFELEEAIQVALDPPPQLTVVGAPPEESDD